MIRAAATVSALATLTAFASSACFAGTSITVQTDLPATVTVDGKAVGKTPLKVDVLYPGERKVEVHNKATGISYTYKVMSPESGMKSRLINSSFMGAAPLSGPVVNQVTLAAPPEPLAKPSTDERRTREKVRIRNTILGGGLANALFNYGPHRHGVFVGLFWLGVLNELLHAK
ncbi:MAG: PEGA domain-containing protein [Candidatus Wallbacteria bacterium]|nr:PEGA domain-containing protein [Candidatus Wallbacteria bacterium]